MMNETYCVCCEIRVTSVVIYTFIGSSVVYRNLLYQNIIDVFGIYCFRVLFECDDVFCAALPEVKARLSLV